MSDYIVTLTPAENAALSFVAFSQQDWIENAVKERCRAAVDEIVQLTVNKCLETGTQIPSSKDAMVSLAFEQGWVKTAAERQAEAEAAAAAALGQNETNTNV